MLCYQRESGGWCKNVNYKAITTEAQKEAARKDFKKTDATIDNGATSREIRYLLKAYHTTANPAYLSAAASGVRYLLKAQYENGGWPQFYPDFSLYRSEITFNDNAMINVLNLLQDIAEQKAPCEVLDKELAKSAGTAVDKGITCILSTQLKLRDRFTVWCAQYDAHTLQPAKARSYELPSLSGAESVGIVDFLMRQPHPSPAIKNAVKAAVKWFEEAKITGYKTVRINAPEQPSGKDVVVVADPSSTLWARFYDLDTEQPFFCSRDGIKKKTLAEIDNERRAGYGWYTQAPEKLITTDYQKWLAVVGK
jgi:PelA/Pel-15E family pectate lyase